MEELLDRVMVGLAILLTLCSYLMIALKGHSGPFEWLALSFLRYYLFLKLTNAIIQEYSDVPSMEIDVDLGLMSSKSRANSLSLRKEMLPESL